MSADNGIYIGRFKNPAGGFEYRVAEGMAIENCDYGVGDCPNELTDAYRVSYYANPRAKHFLVREEALQYAYKVAKEYTDGGMFLEYGVCECHYDVPFPNFTYEEAEKKLHNYWYGHESPPQNA